MKTVRKLLKSFALPRNRKNGIGGSYEREKENTFLKSFIELHSRHIYLLAWDTDLVLFFTLTTINC